MQVQRSLHLSWPWSSLISITLLLAKATFPRYCKKQSLFFPLRQKPPAAIENDLRPISLTCQTAEVMEELALSRILPSVLDHMESKRFAVAEKSTEQALVYILHETFGALDKGNCSLRFFFADFCKSFDLIDHKIFLHKLFKFNLHCCLIGCVAGSLQGRSQFVDLESSASASEYLDGGIPQEMILGPILFAVMVNDLLPIWGPRIKFVDDLTTMEIVPRNSPSYMCHIVSDIRAFACSNNMKLNSKKC